MGSNRVVITGMGIISSYGDTVDQFWNSLLEGKSGISAIEGFDCSDLPSKVAGEIKNWDPTKYMERRDARRVSKYTQYAIATARLALEDAGFKSDEDMEKIDRTRVGATIGTGIGGIDVYSENVLNFDRGGWKKVSPLFIPSTIVNMGSGVVCMHFKLKGPSYTIVSACATANHTIKDAMHIIQRGEADMMVTGGVEAALLPLSVAGFCAARALSTKRNDTPENASRPFDKDRDGFVMSEGGGVLVLESLEHAERRGATIYAEIVGGGMSCDAHHFTEPDPEGLGARNAMKNALDMAGLGLDEVQLLNSHGTSTIVGDIAEANSIKRLFGDHASKMFINSTKSMVGHLLGAAGAFESIASIQSIRTGKVHPTINLDDPIDEAKGLNMVPHKAQGGDIKVVLSNSFGFGGQNCSLVFKKYTA